MRGQPALVEQFQDVVKIVFSVSVSRYGSEKSVSGFGKVKTETTEAVPESRQEEQNSTPTMTGTGTEHEEGEGECVQVVERYWSGREDLASGPASSLSVARNTATFSF